MTGFESVCHPRQKREARRPPFFGAGDRTRLPFPLCGNVWSELRQSQISATVHRTAALEWVLVPRSASINKEDRHKPVFFIWCGRQDSNLHALALEPKSNESTNSTTPAYLVILAWPAGDVNRNWKVLTGTSGRFRHSVQIANKFTRILLDICIHHG